jgi:diguanylate cyclase (GGDEF)-like protein
MAEASPSLLRRRRRILAVFFLATLVGLAAISADLVLHRSVDRSARSQLLLSRLEARSFHLSALEWQAIGAGELSAEVAEAVGSTRAELVKTLSELEQLDRGSAALEPVRRAYEAYAAALDSEFQLIGLGDLEQASALDEEVVDPSFTTLRESLSKAGVVYAARASRTSDTAFLGLALVLFLSGSTIALLFWRFEKAIGASDAAISVQNALARREKELLELNSMGQELQAVDAAAEAYVVLGDSARRLFPNESGALYIVNTALDVLEVANTWGEFPAGSATVEFAHDECLALVEGQAYLVDTDDARLCKHVGIRPFSCLCVPLVAQDETLGVLHLARFESPGDRPERSSDGLILRSQLAVTLAEHGALALMNMRLRKELLDQAITDSLSGLFNRRHMEEVLERELRRAIRNDAHVGVVMIDVDHFKIINDTCGHAAGDATIVALSSLLQGRIRGEDLACRYGGDEFLLVFPGASLADSLGRAEQLRGEVERMSVGYGGRELPGMSVSLGVAMFPEHGKTVDALLRAADDALYRAKDEGRNRTIVAAPAVE